MTQGAIQDDAEARKVIQEWMKDPANREFVMSHNYAGTWAPLQGNRAGIVANFKKSDGADDANTMPAGKKASPTRNGNGYAASYMRSTGISGPYPGPPPAAAPGAWRSTFA